MGLRSELIEDFVGNLEVGEDIQRVGVIVELVVEFDDAACGVGVVDHALVLGD